MDIPFYVSTLLAWSFNVLTCMVVCVMEKIKRVKLNNHEIIHEQSSSANDNDEESTSTTDNTVGRMLDGRNLRSLVRESLSLQSPLISLHSSDAAVVDDVDKSDDGIAMFDKMEDNAAEQARKFFGVL